MKYRKTSLYEQTDATTAKTEPIDLDGSEVISRIQVKFNSTNNGQTPTAHPAKQISLVEIVDGSEVLYSLSGQQIEALMFYEYMRGRGYEIDYRNDCENRMVLDLLFGRRLLDPLLAFDPERFKNPQLKVTHNRALGGSAPDAATLEIFADVFDEKSVTPMGYLMAKEHYEWTAPSAQANEYIDFPNDYPIRRILIEGLVADLWWDNIFSEIELDEENKKRLPWSIDAYDLMQLAINNYGRYDEVVVGTPPSTGTDKVFYITPAEAAVALNTFGAPDQTYLQGERVGGYIDVEVVSIKTFRAIVSGLYPHGILPLDCGLLDDPEDWYDVTAKGKVKMRVKAGGSATAAIILQQLRKY